MIADTLYHGVGPGIAHREPFAYHTAQVNLATGCAEQNHIAPDDVVLGDIILRRVIRRPHHNPATG
ncbi:Uncharacterised protein [Mycobacterium tuberculosis]|uniref:Uncharacterized protein n=1 Tax=Mycobacterium tuberculosis TaxID=1773 RepID=A0A655ADR5_MYCTX|nr:Uncharacterised protein [Mycobacterium tuberculosis]CKR01101.1 Uncharacterised protein [Mycobacterium tuberculosis]CKR50674.1 Uncharacterised protein [Mycobacterium tuberculosis]CKR89262.1 Uncharacterised protein [Mycobacterium tuberculosis]CKS64194.1 Uncharacterised protein [Mycobacterium tuberculosis]